MKTQSNPGLLCAALVTAILCLAGVSGAQAQTWVQKGPAPAQGGQAENITNSPIGGALETVVAHPTNADILWVGSVNGGIFRTDNATAASPTWTAQTDTQTTLSIAALERDVLDGTNNTLVAGIGRTSSFASVGGIRQGILRTTNGGTTWTNPGSAGIADKEIRGVAARGTTILAAVNSPVGCGADSGIWRSTDSGATFTHLATAGGAGLLCGIALDLASDPTDTARFYAPMTWTGGGPFPEDGLYVTADTGANWVQVGSGSVMDVALEAGPSEVQVTVGNGSGANANIFVAVCQAGSLSDLFYSGDAGANWANLDLPMTNEAVGPMAYGIHPGGQCGTHMSLVADPMDNSVVYIGGDRQPANNEANDTIPPQFPNSIGASTYGGRLFKVDADLAPGAQATPITNCSGAPLPPGCGAQSTANDTGPHADSREMVFDANGDLIQTDDGGVYRHTDPNGMAGDWVSVVGNLGAVEQHDAAYDGNSDILISGNQDNGTTSQTTPASNVWTTVFGGDGGDVVVAQDRPAVGQSTRYFSAQNLQGLVRVAYDAANAFTGFANPTLTPLGVAPAPAPQFKTPLKVNDQDPARLILGGGNGVYESLDELDSVSLIAPDVIESFQGGGPIAYGRPTNAELLYFGTTTGSVGRRIGPPGTAVAYSLIGAGTITGVAIDPDSDVQAFATDSANVFRTQDAGVTWNPVTGDLFTAPANSAGQIKFVEYVNTGGDRLVVATERGVYSATEASGFATWTLYGTGLPNAVVYELDFNAADNVLAAGTMGRGTWLLTPGGGGCPADLPLDNQTLNTPQTYYASNKITLGPALIVDANAIHMRAPTVVFQATTTIRNVFSAGLAPCP